MNLRYLLGLTMVIPLLPVMYFQGKKIRRTVPVLPEAGEPDGISFANTNSRLHVLAIGESTMAGVGVSTHGQGFAGSLSRELSELFQAAISWQVFAKSGYTASRITRSLLPDIPTAKTDLVVVGLGGNDAFRLRTPAMWRRNISGLIAGLRQRYPHAPIVFTSMPPIKDFPAFTPLIRFTIGNLVEILGKELRKVAAEHKGVYYDQRVIRLEKWRTILADEMPEGEVFFSDGVHPSSYTYKVWGRETARYIYRNDKLRAQLLSTGD
ncbi:MAG: SGNH/GDSL hydrolase family protein [Cyclobacteriaceae bacterium]